MTAPEIRTSCSVSSGDMQGSDTRLMGSPIARVGGDGSGIRRSSSRESLQCVRASRPSLPRSVTCCGSPTVRPARAARRGRSATSTHSWFDLEAGCNCCAVRPPPPRRQPKGGGTPRKGKPRLPSRAGGVVYQDEGPHPSIRGKMIWALYLHKGACGVGQKALPHDHAWMVRDAA